MRSPVSRLALERALRAAAFGLLALCAWLLATPARPHARTTSSQGELAGSLARWSRQVGLDSVHVTLRTAPGTLERDWLRALAGAGSPVSWSGPVRATAVELVPVADPAGGVRVLAAAPDSAWIRLTDSLGVIDSVPARNGGASFRLAAQRGALAMDAAGQRAMAGPSDTVAGRRAVVLGRAEWEARFVVTALEERGWTVDARLAVSPGIAVTQGRPLPLDTARHAVVVALDSLSQSDAALVSRFIASGGGAVLGANAARSAPAIAAGAVGPRVRAPLAAFSASTARPTLAMDPVIPRGDAVVLERQDRHVVVAARRIGAGRAVQLGYDETWRWRMSSNAEAVDQHRDWWAGVVAAAAYRAEGGERGTGNGERAPLASLVAALGPPRGSAAIAPAAGGWHQLLPLAAALMLVCLLAEWASRRLRGAA